MKSITTSDTKPKKKWIKRLIGIVIGIVVIGLVIGIIEVQGIFNKPQYSEPQIQSGAQLSEAQSESPRISSWVDTAIKNQASLKDVRVPTSHNSYLWGAQHGSRASASYVLACLRMGARCLELDVFRKSIGPEPLTPSDPSIIVAHGTQWKKGNFLTTTSVPFERCIAVIAEYPTDDPIFLCLEMNCNDDEVACNRVADILLRYFGSRLATRHAESEWPKVKLESLKGKIVLMSGGGVAGSKLSEIIHLRWGSIIANINSVQGPQAVVTPLCRVYPDADRRGVLSFNFDPEPFYKAGAQFVALNYQKM